MRNVREYNIAIVDKWFYARYGSTSVTRCP